MLYLKLLPILFFPVLFWMIPPPESLSAQTWHLVGIYLAMLCGLVLRPFTDAVIMLIILGFASLFIAPGPLFAGFGSPMVWFIISAFIICKAFVITGLGKRIAYLLLQRYGKNTLTLGYLMMVPTRCWHRPQAQTCRVPAASPIPFSATSPKHWDQRPIRAVAGLALISRF